GIPRRFVTSPTFSLVQEYHGRLWLFHFDTYRLRNVSEFVELGIDEYLLSGGVCLIEWADRVRSVLPEDRLGLTLRNTGITSRSAEFSAQGPQACSVLRQLHALHLTASPSWKESDVGHHGVPGDPASGSG